MRKVLFVAVIMFGFSGLAFAGEKEELQLLIEARSAQFELIKVKAVEIQKDIQAAQAKLKAITEKEQPKQDKKK